MAKAPTKKTGTALVNWDEELAKEAEMQGDVRSTGGGKFINTRGAVFSVGGEEIGQAMNVVILDYIIENQYYDHDTPFDPDNPSSPICFAFGRKEEGMAPHELSAEKQNETCAGCPQNAYGSAGKGRKGKACKNVMRLALIHESDSDEAGKIAEADVYMMKVSTTNVKHFAKFKESLANPNFGRKVPSWAVVCEMKIKPNKDTQIELAFKRGDDIEGDEVLIALKAKKDTVAETIDAPYQPASEAVEEEKPAPKNTKLSNRRK